MNQTRSDLENKIHEAKSDLLKWTTRTTMAVGALIVTLFGALIGVLIRFL